MTETTSTGDALIAVANEFYRRADSGSPDVPELFSDDAQIFFPKFGIVRGQDAIVELANGLMTTLSSLQHNMDELAYLVAGDSVVVEGTTHGSTKSGQSWRGGETPGGRFCSVFDINPAGLITRMHIYLDPDYVSADEDRFLWGHDRTW